MANQLLILGLLSLGAFCAWALCAAAGNADREANKQFREYCERMRELQRKGGEGNGEDDGERTAQSERDDPEH